MHPHIVQVLVVILQQHLIREVLRVEQLQQRVQLLAWLLVLVLTLFGHQNIIMNQADSPRFRIIPVEVGSNVLTPQNDVG